MNNYRYKFLYNNITKMIIFLLNFYVFLNFKTFAGVQEQQDSMIKFGFEKLVRDRSIEDLEDRGLKVSWKYLDQINHLNSLKLKLVEEAQEVVNAKTINELYEELGDLLDVLEVLFEKGKICQKKLRVFRDKKKNKNGSFEKGIYVEYCLVPASNKQEVLLFRKKSDKYPEIKD